jgi:hypothetical protein
MEDVIRISDATYLKLADFIVSNIRNKDYLKDSISVVDGDMEFTLSFTVIAYYSKSRDEETYGQDILSDIIPVWWDFEAVDGGMEFITDFSFDELKTYIL